MSDSGKCRLVAPPMRSTARTSNAGSAWTTLKVEEPEGRAAGVIVNSVSELVEKLRNEAKVI